MRIPSPASGRARAHLGMRGWLNLGLALTVVVLVTLRPFADNPVVSADTLSIWLGGLAAACCFVAAWRAAGALRRSWLLFGATMAMWFVADLLWARYGGATGYQSVLSLADALYLIGLVPASLGLVLYPAGTWEPGARVRLLLDIVVLGGALLLVSEVAVLGEVVSRVGLNWSAFALGVYPVTDVLLAGLAVLLLLRSSGRPRPDLMLIAASFATWTAADNGYALLSARGQYDMGTAVSAAYVLGPVLLGLAALTAVASASGPRTLRRDVSGMLAPLLPDLTALGALVVCMMMGLDGWAEWALAGAVLALTGARQLARTIDNQRMHGELAQRVHERTQDLVALSEHHQRILDSVGEGIFGVDRELRISFVNPAAALLLGWDADELLGQDACAALCSEQHDECLVSMVMALGEAVTQSARSYRRHDGTDFPVEVTASPKAGPSGVDGAVVVFRDITERTILDDMKRQFVSAVSHELRTPLTAIRGSLEVLADGEAGALPTDAKRVVDVASRGTERLTRLVNDIIDMERLEAGSFSVRSRPEDIAPLVVEAADAFLALADERRVNLVIGEASGSALCDADRVVQALINLIGNALKFTQPGGTVSVSAKPCGHEIVLSVRDEGRGIPAEDLEAIFERFHQVQQSDARKLGGTGLGLAITKAIVERHGGRIWVESELGAGSTFRFTLPQLALPDGNPGHPGRRRWARRRDVTRSGRDHQSHR